MKEEIHFDLRMVMDLRVTPFWIFNEQQEIHLGGKLLETTLVSTLLVKLK